MSRSKKIFGLIKKELPGVELCRDMLVVLPTEHILRGFLIETTMEKGRIYLWRVVTPLHRPMGSSAFLDYSTRVPETGQDIYIDPSSYKESAERIGGIVSEHVEYLRAVRHPEDFLRHVGHMIGNSSVNFRFDLALTYYRLGRVRQSQDILRALDVEVDQMDPKMRLPVDDIIKQVAREIRSNPKALTNLLDEWEAQNIEKLGLQPSRLVRAASRLLR
jgi:hypothetical protein